MLEMDDTIRLDRRSFEALAAESRVKVLKALSKRRKTLTELAKELSLSNSTMKEHLEVLVGAGLIIQRDEGRKWKYYELTRKGQGIVSPYPARVLIMLAVSIILVLGSGWNFISAFGGPAVQMAEPMEAGAPGLEIGVPGAEKNGVAEEMGFVHSAVEGEEIVPEAERVVDEDLVVGGMAEPEAEAAADEEPELAPAPTGVEAMAEEAGEPADAELAPEFYEGAPPEAPLPGPAAEEGFPYSEGMLFGLSVLVLCGVLYFVWKR